MTDDGGFLLVLTTVAELEQARALARGIVERRLAACVTCLPGAMSFFRWEGDEVREEPEIVLLVKTHSAQRAALEAYFQIAHPYSVPEFVALDPAHIAPAYRAWLAAELSGPESA